MYVNYISTGLGGDALRQSNTTARLAAASLAGLLLAGASPFALAAPATPDTGDARIEQLEQEMQQLIAANQKLQSEDAALAEKADQLEGEVEQLRRAQAAQITELQTQAQSIEQAEAKIPPAPSVVDTMLNGRPVLTSANGRFSLTVHTVSQLDTGAYFQGSPGPTATDLRRDGPALGATAANVDAAHARDLKDGTDFRRARLGLDGTAFGDWDYRILFDFGGTGVENSGQLYETWVQYSGLKPARFRIGAFPPTIGLEDSASTSGMPFIERSAIEDMARGLAAGDTRLAAQAYAYGPRWLASLAITGRTIGVINAGAAAAAPQTFGDQTGVVGRLAFTPLQGDDWRIDVGVHGSYAEPANNGGPAANGRSPLADHVVAFSNTQQLRVDGTKLINTGNIDANHAETVGAEFALQKGPFIIQSEYEDFGVQRADVASDPHFQGYYAEAVWTITGEPRVYNAATAAFDAPIPAHPFNVSDGALGAFEIGVRFADADLDYHAGPIGSAPAVDAVRGGDERNVSVDLNWYPNSMIKFMLDYEHVRINRLSPNAAIYATPVGAQVGQLYDAVAVRSQFAF